MKLFHRLMLATVTAVALFGTGGVISSSQAEAQSHQHHTRYYYVYYRSCPCSAWVYYGAYTCPTQAQYAASYINGLGYYTYIY